MKLKWHNKICPTCKNDQDLRVMYVGTARLTNSGSEDDGDHEWDNDNVCTCRWCGFSGPARMFDWDGSGAEQDGEVDLLEDDEITFELTVCQMTKDPDGDGYILADSIGAPQEAIQFIDIMVTRRHERLGVIDIIEEIEDLPPAQSTAEVAAKLEAKYGLEAEWV